MLAAERAAPTAGLRLRGVGKRYGAMLALNGVGFEAPLGHVTALLGENGAGKSTLVKVLSGGVVPDAGWVEIDGEERPIAGAGRFLAENVAVVQQEGSLVPTLTVAENVFLGGPSPRGSWALRGLVDAARPFLAKVGLEHIRPTVVAAELSVAEQQLVEVARLLTRKAPVLVLDEPTAALSDVEIARVLTVVRRLTETGHAVIYVTHRLGEVFELATSATILRNGEVAARVDVSDVSMDDVIRSMLGRDLDVLFPERGTAVGESLLGLDRVLVPGLAAPVSLEVRRGEILGLTGQLGSGSAVTLRALAGLAQVEEGNVVLKGRPLGRGASHDLRAGRIAYCSDDRKGDGIFALRSSVENLSAASLAKTATAGLLRTREEKRRARRIADQVGLAPHRLPVPVGALSGGNQQKVVLGKWVASDPEVLLVDEPTRGVDIGSRAEIYTLLRRLSAEGMGIVVCSSDHLEVLGLCDRVATFYKGQLVEVKAAGDLTAIEVAAHVTHGRRRHPPQSGAADE